MVFCLILLLDCLALVGGNAGSDFLNQKEQQVGMIVDQAIINYNKQCGAYGKFIIYLCVLTDLGSRVNLGFTQ